MDQNAVYDRKHEIGQEKGWPPATKVFFAETGGGFIVVGDDQRVNCSFVFYPRDNHGKQLTKRIMDRGSYDLA